jgi:hypothetical protein
MLQRCGEKVAEFERIFRGCNYQARNMAQIREIKYTMVGRAIFADQSRAVHS